MPVNCTVLTNWYKRSTGSGFSIRALHSKITDTVDDERGKSMSASVLSTFMRFTMQQTGAERALACDTQLTLIDSANLTLSGALPEELATPLRQAMESGEIGVGNNAVIDSTQAPTTNTNFNNLRGFVIIPIQGIGAVYVDRPVRKGVVSREKVIKLAKLASSLNLTPDLSEIDLIQQFEML